MIGKVSYTVPLTVTVLPLTRIRFLVNGSIVTVSDTVWLTLPNEIDFCVGSGIQYLVTCVCTFPLPTYSQTSSTQLFE